MMRRDVGVREANRGVTQGTSEGTVQGHHGDTRGHSWDGEHPGDTTGTPWDRDLGDGDTLGTP